MTPFARACRAIVDLQRGDPVNDFVWDTIWNERHKALDEWPVAQAVMVVLKAVREPSISMVEAAWHEAGYETMPVIPEHCWPTMIDEILNFT
jgi:hypothetical protein